MLLWFVGMAVAIVWLVFRSPAIDLRLVVAGVLVPLVEALTGGPRLLHALLGAVVVLALVMAATRGRRLVRRQWLGLPIGLFLHLALDGSFTRAELFWWPFLGWGTGGGALPELDRPVPLIVALELVGAAACWWCGRTFGLDDPARRQAMARTGQVDRRLLPPGGGASPTRRDVTLATHSRPASHSHRRPGCGQGRGVNLDQGGAWASLVPTRAKRRCASSGVEQLRVVHLRRADGTPDPADGDGCPVGGGNRTPHQSVAAPMMTIRSMRHALVLTALAALATVPAACGDDRETKIDTAPVSTTPVASAPRTGEGGDGEGEVVASEVVVLDEGDDADPDGRGPGLIVDGAGLRAFAGRFFAAGDEEAAATLAEVADDLPGGDGQVFVGGVVAMGCSVPDDVELRRTGDDLRLEPVREAPEPEPIECVRAITTVAVVAVDRATLPDEPTVDGEPASAPVGPGEVVAFERLGGEAARTATEVRSLDELEALLADLDGAPAVEGLALTEVDPEQRRFLFVLGGCQAVTAELVIADDQITAVARQDGDPGEQVECEALEPYLVVADVARTASEGLRPA